MYQEIRWSQKLKRVPLPKPGFKEEANRVEIGRGRAGNFALGFHMGGLSPSPSGKSAGQEKTSGVFWGHAMLYPKVVIDEGQRVQPLPRLAKATGFFFSGWSWAKLTL